MSMRRFEISFFWGDFDNEELSTATIELDEALIEAVDDDWRSQLYDLHTPEEIASHIARNYFVNRINIKQMDGWADQENNMIKVIKYPYLDDFRTEAKEITK